MKSLYLTFLVFLLILPTVSAQTYDGKIYSLFYEPIETVILDSLTISMGVQNTGEEFNAYLLKLYITKDGRVLYETSFTFQLQPTEAVTFSPTYVPEELGRYQIVVELFDQYELEKYDSRSLSFYVISDIGPFDLSLDVLTRTVKPGEELPMIIKLTNMGEHGIDVKVKVTVNCYQQTDIRNDFFVYIDGRSSLDRYLSMQTCEEVGLHDVSSQILVFNKTWVDSTNTFFTSDTYVELKMRPPEEIELMQGSSELVEIFVDNIADIAVSDLRLVVEDIPLGWFSTKPSSIIRVRPNERVLFLLNISIPMDAQTKEYHITILAAADEVIRREDSTLKVLPASTAAVEVTPRVIDIYLYAFVGLLIAVIAMLLWKMQKGRRYGREEALRKIRDVVKE